MKIANAVIENTREEIAGQTRKVIRKFVRVLPVEVASVATEARFIPLAEEIPIDTAYDSVSVQSVQPDMDFSKDARPKKLAPMLEFEFTQRKFTTVAVVALPEGTIRSRDAFKQAESYGPQIALIPLWGNTELPTGAKLAGVIELEGFAVSAQDGETGQEYTLGFRFESEDAVNWVQLALNRRKHFKADKQSEDSDEITTSTYSSIFFTSDDRQVIARVAQKFGRGMLLANGKTSFSLTSEEALEKCREIELEVVRLRQKAIIERDFEAEEALKP